MRIEDIKINEGDKQEKLYDYYVEVYEEDKTIDYDEALLKYGK